MAISTQNITQYIKDTESNILKTTSQNGMIAHATDTLKFFIARDGGWVGYDPVARHGSYTLPNTTITVPAAPTWHFDASVGSSLRSTGGPIDSSAAGSVYEWQSIAGAPHALRAQFGTARYDPAGITGDDDSNTYPCVELPSHERMFVGQWSTPRIIKGDYTLFIVFRPNWQAYENGYNNVAGPDYQYRTVVRDFFHGAPVTTRTIPGSQLARFGWYQQWNEDRIYALPWNYYSNTTHILTMNSSTTKPGETVNTQRVDDRPHIFTYQHSVNNNANNDTTIDGHLYSITPRSSFSGYITARLGTWSSDCPALGYNTTTTAHNGGYKYCELLQLEGRLTIAQVNTIQAHLANKWGTYVTPNMS